MSIKLDFPSNNKEFRNGLLLLYYYFFYNLFIHKSKVYFANIRKNIEVYLMV